MALNVHEILLDEEIEECHRAFKQFDEDQSGTIESWELKALLQKLGQDPSDQEILHMISEVIARQKLESSDSGKERDVFDAWRAVGGGEDGDGEVNSELLIKIIKHDFCLNIDIETMLTEMDTSGDGKVDFDEFKMIFEKSG